MPESGIPRVLFDENVDHQLKPLFDKQFNVQTVSDRGWKGMKNGELLGAAANEFDLFVTMDKNLSHQQNLQSFDLAIILIRSVSNAFVHVCPLMPKKNAAVHTVKPGRTKIVEH